MRVFCFLSYCFGSPSVKAPNIHIRYCNVRSANTTILPEQREQTEKLFLRLCRKAKRSRFISPAAHLLTTSSAVSFPLASKDWIHGSGRGLVPLTFSFWSFHSLNFINTKQALHGVSIKRLLCKWGKLPLAITQRPNLSFLTLLAASQTKIPWK